MALKKKKTTERKKEKIERKLLNLQSLHLLRIRKNIIQDVN